VARERTAERDHRSHAIRHHLGELAGVETAKTPADQADLAPTGVAELMHQIDHRTLHTVAQAEIAALPPAADRITAVLQKAAQRARRSIRGDQPGQHQYRMTVAFRRQAEQRQCAEKRTKLMDGSPFQKHQGSGRRAQGLGGGGHCSSFQSRPLKSRQPANGPSLGRRKPVRIVPQCNNL